MSTNDGDIQRVGSELLRAVTVMDRLRSPGGCPWDAEQTHASLAPYAVEEAHELAEAAESGEVDHLREELGDLLLQVLFHARIAAEAEDGFDIDDVATALVDKLTYRHPHVFTDDGERGLSAQEVTDQWEVLKAAQQRRTSVLEGIPTSLPALARAQKVLSRIAKAGLEIEADTAESADQIGARLLELVHEAQRQGVDAEAALRNRIRGLEEQVRRAENAAKPDTATPTRTGSAEPRQQ